MVGSLEICCRIFKVASTATFDAAINPLKVVQNLNSLVRSPSAYEAAAVSKQVDEAQTSHPNRTADSSHERHCRNVVGPFLRRKADVTIQEREHHEDGTPEPTHLEETS